MGVRIRLTPGFLPFPDELYEVVTLQTEDRPSISADEVLDLHIFLLDNDILLEDGELVLRKGVVPCSTTKPKTKKQLKAKASQQKQPKTQKKEPNK